MTARSLFQASSTMEEPIAEARGIIVGMLLGAAFWVLVVWWLA